VKIGSAVRPGRRIEKKGKDRTGQSKKSQSGNILPIWRGASTIPIETKVCMTGSLPDIIKYAKFQNDILGGTILKGVEFPIFLLIFAWALQQCSATELPVIRSTVTASVRHPSGGWERGEGARGVEPAQPLLNSPLELVTYCDMTGLKCD